MTLMSCGRGQCVVYEQRVTVLRVDTQQGGSPIRRRLLDDFVDCGAQCARGWWYGRLFAQLEQRPNFRVKWKVEANSIVLRPDAPTKQVA
jgi:hypothetical protein